MNRHSDCNTREHILATGEELCMHRGFIGMGLSELLKTAEVPKGSFYHYFRSKESFGVALLERHYADYLQRLEAHFTCGEGNYRDRLLAWYQYAFEQFCQQETISGCLTVKLSAEVCDLSEDMRATMDKGTSQVIAVLATALEKGRRERSLWFDGEAQSLSQALYSLWLGANLQAKITRRAAPLESALVHLSHIIAAPVI